MHLIPAHRSDDSAVGAAVAVIVDAGLFEAMVVVVVAASVVAGLFDVVAVVATVVVVVVLQLQVLLKL